MFKVQFSQARIVDYFILIRKNIKKSNELILSSILLFSHLAVSDSATPQTAVRQASLSFTTSQSLHKLTSIESVRPSNHLVLFLCCPFPLLPSIFLTIRVFFNESALCNRWPKYQSFSFSSCPSIEYSGLISFRMDWFDHFAVQGTLKCLLQQYS